MKDAKPVIEFELDNVVREFSSAAGEAKPDPRKLTKAVTERVLPLVARIDSSSDQSHFVAMVADKAKVQADLVWQDLKVVAKRLKEAELAANPNLVNPNVAANTFTSPRNTIAKARTSSEMTKRVDLIERRLFGLLFLMEKESVNNAQLPMTNVQISGYKDQIKKMAGDSYESRAKSAEENRGDLMFEAESFFGTDAGKDGENWIKPMKELLSNFEEDILSDEIISAMHELKMAEKAGNQERVMELAKKCQALSIRKAQLNKK